MLSPPSLQFDYFTVFSGDPALDLPEVPIERPDETPEQTKARKAAADERKQKLDTAHETGAWDPIIRTGERPTRFKMRSIHGELAYLEGERQRRNLTDGEWAELALRYALVKVEDFGEQELKIETHKDANGRRIVALATIDKLRAVGIDSADPMLGHNIVTELGLRALQRALEGIAPKR